MFTALTRWVDSRAHSIVFTVVMWLYIVLDIWWKGSDVANVLKYVFLSYGPFWIGVKAWAGYERRKPYWTRESWLRYLRLAAMPVVALALVLWLSSFDMSRSWGVLGAPQSPTRAFWIVIMLAMILLGALGLMLAIDWLTKGEASEQFTRTRWFQRRARAN